MTNRISKFLAQEFLGVRVWGQTPPPTPEDIALDEAEKSAQARIIKLQLQFHTTREKIQEETETNVRSLIDTGMERQRAEHVAKETEQSRIKQEHAILKAAIKEILDQYQIDRERIAIPHHD